MDQSFDIQAYMTKGIEGIVTDAIKATLKNPKESAFMLRFAAASRAASRRRAESEKAGEHVPPFLSQHYQPVQSSLRRMLFPL